MEMYNFCMKDYSLMMRISYGLWEEEKNNCRPGVYKGLASSADIAPDNTAKVGEHKFLWW